MTDDEMQALYERAEDAKDWLPDTYEAGSIEDVVDELVAALRAARTEAETLRSALIDGAVDSYCKERGLVVRPEDIADRPDFRLVNTCETCDCPDPWCPTRGYHAEDGDD